MIVELDDQLVKDLRRLCELAQRHPEMELKVNSGVLSNAPWWYGRPGISGDLERVQIDLMSLDDQLSK